MPASSRKRQKRCGSRRGYHRVLNLARTLADLDGAGDGGAHPRRQGARLPGAIDRVRARGRLGHHVRGAVRAVAADTLREFSG